METSASCRLPWAALRGRVERSECAWWPTPSLERVCARGQQRCTALTFLFEARADDGALLDDEGALIGDRLGRPDRLDERLEVVEHHWKPTSTGGNRGVSAARARVVHRIRPSRYSLVCSSRTCALACPRSSRQKVTTRRGNDGKRHGLSLASVSHEVLQLDLDRVISTGALADPRRAVQQSNLRSLEQPPSRVEPRQRRASCVRSLGQPSTSLARKHSKSRYGAGQIAMRVLQCEPLASLSSLSIAVRGVHPRQTTYRRREIGRKGFGVRKRLVRRGKGANLSPAIGFASTRLRACSCSRERLRARGRDDVIDSAVETLCLVKKVTVTE